MTDEGSGPRRLRDHRILGSAAGRRADHRGRRAPSAGRGPGEWCRRGLGLRATRRIVRIGRGLHHGHRLAAGDHPGGCRHAGDLRRRRAGRECEYRAGCSCVIPTRFGHALVGDAGCLHLRPRLAGDRTARHPFVRRREFGARTTAVRAGRLSAPGIGAGFAAEAVRTAAEILGS